MRHWDLPLALGKPQPQQWGLLEPLPAITKISPNVSVLADLVIGGGLDMVCASAADPGPSQNPSSPALPLSHCCLAHNLPAPAQWGQRRPSHQRYYLLHCHNMLYGTFR